MSRALQVVTVTDVVWDVVTVTEYDAVTTSVVAQAQAATPVAAVTTAQTNAAAGNQVVNTVQKSSSDAVVVVAAAPSTTVTPVAVSTPTTTSVAAAGNVVTAQTTTTPAAAAAAPVATTAVSSTSAGIYSGEATYYELGLTACGQTYADTDYVAAISYLLFDQNGTANPNSKRLEPCLPRGKLTRIDNPHCGRRIRVYRGSASVDVTIVDRCAGCEGQYNVDLSPVAFQTLATEAEGRVDVTWSYI